ncbi:MAG TPA: DUF3311 domain-containing protein [Candidatus Sulfotelmatobacter sp.]|nr:DUF3311 domain-containing protein [Candidatus Sulfotelmatobacter sp.]
MKRSRPYRALAVIPALLILVGAPLLNGVPGYVFGLPVMLAWIVGCVLATSLTMAVIAALDRRRDREERGGAEPR